VLPAGFAETPERRSRFAREAKLLASLNHPNIAAIYGLEESDGVHYLVLELVPGETLAEKIKLSPLPVDEALDTARQIAEALDTAHENGVIHRDLKPANIKITPEGQVKVLDFGLAKAFVEDAQNGSMSDSPTLSAMATREGIILGTAPYMSPEQARGKPVDKRSDIFSFGSVLYEMLTGRPAFLGDDVSDTLAAVLKTEPDWSLLPANTDARIRALLRACLQKDRKARRRDIGDVRAEIGEVLAHRGREREEIAAAPPAELGWKRAIPLALAVSLVVGVIAGIIGWNLKPEPPPRPVARFPMVLPSDQQLTDVGRRVVVLSPDGRRLVYVANNQVYLR
jgi:serine/threonine-protein kinase